MIKKIFDKKNLKIIVPAVIVVLVMLVILIVSLTKKDDNVQGLHNYKLQLSYNDESKVLSGSEEVEYYNNSENMFTSLYFHLYPNAFREGASCKVVSSVNESNAYPNGKDYGYINIKKVESDEGELSFQIAGEDENILVVELGGELYPDEIAKVKIDFEVKLANIHHRLGYGDKTINFGNFYPIACVYEEGIGFSTNLYHSNGDPFFSECSNYEVEISYDKVFEIASSGVEVSSVLDNQKITKTFKAKSVRDFCFVLSENFEKTSSKVDGVVINYFGYKGDENLETCLDVSGDAIKTFNKLFGDYPYEEISIVKANFIHGGMEFPNIVLISDNVELQEDYNYVIVHEIAHQWWYGVVGNDEYNYAWIDEGLAEYSTLLFFEENSKYGYNYKEMTNNALENYLTFEEVYRKVTGTVDGRMQRPLDEFNTEPEYAQCVYTKGVLLFNNIRDLIGRKKLIKTLEGIYSVYSFKNITPEEFVHEFEKAGGKAMVGVFNSWLNGKVILTKN